MTMFHTGGKGNEEHIFQVHAAVRAFQPDWVNTEPEEAVESTNIAMGSFGNLDSSGYAYKKLKDGDTASLTPNVNTKDYYALNSIPTKQKYTLAHICEADTPTNKDRLTIGVGEKVDLGGMPDDTNTLWGTSAGTLSSTTGGSVTLTAPDRHTSAKVTVTVHGQSLSPIVFDVIEPSGVIMVTNGLRHTVSRPNIGIHTVIYLTPDSVNFGSVWCQEEQAYAVANGVYAPFNNFPHETRPTPVPFTSTVVPRLGTSAGSSEDNIYSGDPLAAPPFAPGTEVYTIPWDFRVTTNAWKTNFITLTGTCSLGTNGVLTVSKAGASWSCNVTDASVSY